MGGADMLAEILITGMLGQDGKKPGKGCFIWIAIFLIALGLYIGYEFLIDKG